jgi:hypothetical protein
MKTETEVVKVAGRKWNTGYHYHPNSIIHGMAKPVTGGPGIKTETLLRLEIERMRDFIEFLFDHSEHCDHISHADAWKEFEIYEAKTSHQANRIREYRKKLKAS